MAKSLAQLKHPFAKIVGDFPTEDVFVIAAHIKEGLSKIAEMRVVFAIKHNDMPLSQVLGKNFTVEVKTKGPDDADKRKFTGTCIEAEFLGLAQGYDMFTLELRPWLWFLTQMQNNRIFQDKSVPEIIKAIFSERGFSDYEDKLSGTYDPRKYVVQYDETDFDFIVRMMEEEGMYFFMDWSGSVEKLVLADDRGAHQPIAGESEIEFKPRVMKAKREENTIFEFGDKQKVVPGKVSLVDRNFENSRTKLDVTQIHERGSHSHKSYEQYRMHGHYENNSQAEHYARVAVDAHAHEAERFAAAANVRSISAGCTMSMKEHPVGGRNAEYLIVEAEHFL
jgi:type VI secretion system secreted protein VgrG